MDTEHIQKLKEVLLILEQKGNTFMANNVKKAIQEAQNKEK